MAYGKRPLTTDDKDALAASAMDKMVERTEPRMLRVPFQGTPMGDDSFLTAVERTMTEDKKKPCAVCKEVKGDVLSELTGTCAECWRKK